MKDTSATIQVLNYLDKKIDAAMPIVTDGIKTAAQKTEHYGILWMKFRAWEIFTYGIIAIFGLILTAIIMYMAFRFGKAAQAMSDTKKDNSGYVLAAVYTALVGVGVGIFSMVGIWSNIPKGIAAMANPEGFGVQLIIEGFKK